MDSAAGREKIIEESGSFEESKREFWQTYRGVVENEQNKLGEYSATAMTGMLTFVRYASSLTAAMGGLMSDVGWPLRCYSGCVPDREL